MRVLLLLAVFLPLTVLAQLAPTPDQGGDSEVWTHRAVLDYEGKVVLFWTPNMFDITFKLIVAAKGWIGMGFSPDGKMPNSDIVVGWVINNEPSLQDRFAIGNSEPIRDEKQDYQLTRGYENDTHTVLTFRRNYDTCDPKDTKITNDTMRVIYAYTDEDPKDSLLPPHRWQGHRNLILSSMNNVVQGVIPNTKPFEMRLPNITLPRTQKSLCWQKVFKYTPLSSRDAVVGFEPLWKNTTEGNVDHMRLYICDGPSDQILWDQYATDKGSICDNADAIHQYGNCTKVFATAMAGSLGYVIPQMTSYTLNQVEQGPSYFLLRIDYSNWNTANDIPDDSGMALIVSSNPPAVPAATLTVGHDLGLSQIIPLDQPAFVTLGHCDAECTKNNFPDNGIFVYEIFLDARSTGRKVTLRHFRNGTELEPVVKDSAFVSGSQIYRSFLDPVNILKGDNLMLECVYDTISSASTLVGGIQSDSEACRAYLNYFPKMALQSCTSSPPLSQIFDFLNTQQIGIDHNSVTYQDTHVANSSTKLTEYIKYFNWNGRSHDFQNLTKSTYVSLCTKNGDTLISEPRGLFKIEHPYYEIANCNMLIGNNNTQSVPSPLPGIDQGIFPPKPDQDGGMPMPGHEFHPGNDPMMGDQSHVSHGDMHPDSHNDTHNVVETQPPAGGNHSASTQPGNAANSLKHTTWQLSGLLAVLVTLVSFTSRQH